MRPPPALSFYPFAPEHPTFSVLPAQLPLLNKAPEALRLHEDLQETAQALGGHGLAEGITL